MVISRRSYKDFRSNYLCPFLCIFWDVINPICCIVLVTHSCGHNPSSILEKLHLSTFVLPLLFKRFWPNIRGWHKWESWPLDGAFSLEQKLAYRGRLRLFPSGRTKTKTKTITSPQEKAIAKLIEFSYWKFDNNLKVYSKLKLMLSNALLNSWEGCTMWNRKVN